MFQKITHFLNHRKFILFAIFLMAVILGAQSDRFYKWSNPPETKFHNISSDGSGYYAYLPQFFIYGTKHFEFTDGILRKYPESKFYEGVTPAEGNGKSNKYFSGTAICIAPFFWTAHQITKISGGDADGYSAKYEVSVLMAAIAFWLLGVLSLLTLLKLYGISRFAILFGIVGLTFATNLNYYIVYDPSFSHVYTFGLVCFFLLQVKRFADSQKSRHVLWIFFLLGLITIIRPTNLLVVLMIPFFFDSFKTFWNRFKSLFLEKKITLLSGIVLFGLLIFVQFLNIHSQFGNWGFNAYSTEGFDYIFSPKFGEVLFGFRKGFFVYTPFFLLIFPALYFLFRWNKYFFLGLVIFLFVFIYIMASWWCWYYGGSLGMRPLIDIYGIMIIPIIVFFDRAKLILRTMLIAFIALMIHFNLVLNYQMMHAILHYSEMDKEKFNTVFMQTGKRFDWIFHMKQPGFDVKKYQPVEKYYFNSNIQDWSKTRDKSEIEMNSQTYLKSLIFTPDERFINSEIAVKVQNSMLLTNEKNIPKMLLFGYQNGERKEVSANFFGPQIQELNQYYPIDAPLYSSQKYAAFDSLEVVVENGEGQGKVKDIRCTFYAK